MVEGLKPHIIKVTQISQMTQIFDLCGLYDNADLFSLDFAELFDEKSASSAKSA